MTTTWKKEETFQPVLYEQGTLMTGQWTCCVIVCVFVYLLAGHPGRQYESHVVSVDHGEDADSPGCESPGVLESQLFLARLLRILKRDLEHLGKVLTEVVRRGTLRRHRAKQEDSIFCSAVQRLLCS